jgi:hypothetical protein
MTDAERIALAELDLGRDLGRLGRAALGMQSLLFKMVASGLTMEEARAVQGPDH